MACTEKLAKLGKQSSGDVLLCSICLLILDPYPKIQCTSSTISVCCQPFLCSSPICNKQDILAARKEALVLFVPEEFIWDTMEQVLFAVKDVQVRLRNRRNAQCFWNAVALKQYLCPDPWSKS